VSGILRRLARLADYGLAFVCGVSFGVGLCGGVLYCALQLRDVL